MEVFDGFVVEDIIVGRDDRAAFFEVFDFVNVALVSFLGREWAIGAFCDAFVAERLRGDDANSDNLAGEFVFEDFVFGPGINSIKDNAFLAGGDEIFGFGDSLADDPIGASFFADGDAESALVLGSVRDAAFGHFF